MSKEVSNVFNVTGSDVSNNPLEVFDTILQEGGKATISASEHDELKEMILRCILHVGNWPVYDHEVVEQVALRALDDHRELDQKAAIGACLLRLLPERTTSWVQEPPWRRSVAALFDAQFADSLYRHVDVEIDSMSHEKLAALEKAVERHERGFEEALQTLTSLERLAHHRQKLMHVINDKFGECLIKPFLPEGVVADLLELYEYVEKYVNQQESLGVVEAYNAAIDKIEKSIDTLEDENTLYSTWLAKRVGHKLKSLIQESFADNKAVQPATLLIRARDKKYPFHHDTVKVGLDVENQGPGYAYEVELLLVTGDDLNLSSDEVRIGKLAPATTQLVEIEAQVRRRIQEVPMLAHLEWQDFDGEKQESEFDFVIKAQKSDVDWDQLVRNGPYSLEPVVTEQDLAGRIDVLNRLIGTAQGATVGSSIIYGQKRVGKTSIARALWSYLRGLQEPNYLVVYLDDYIEETAGDTIGCLSNRICEELASIESRIGRIEIPEASQSLSPLISFLKEVAGIIQNGRIVIILDEFDELPLDLYARGALAKAFFLKLRSISSHPQVGFVLVGGEKMAHIIEHQGIRLNKWDTMQVDYFSRQSEWADYRELILHPVGEDLEYAEQALEALYELTAGNPYFTKVVCGSILNLASDKRDCYVTRTEVDQAARTAIRKRAGKNDFQHFWDDGIVVTGPEAREKSIERRKSLIALSDVLEQQSPAPEPMIAEHRIARGIAGLDSHLKEFLRRKVTTGDPVRKVYDFKVPLFQMWLKESGIHDLIADFPDLNAALKQRQAEERIRVKAGEIVELIDEWPPYQGQPITEDRIRAWLDQFGDVRKQRLMFKILQDLRFYSNKFMREKMSEVHLIVRQDLKSHLEHGKRKRDDILVSYLDSPAKSGAHFAQIYSDEAKIYVDNVVPKNALGEALQEAEGTQAIVFIDDFVGTGGSAEEYLSELDGDLSDIVCKQDIKVVFVAMVAYLEGWARVERAVDKLNMPVEAHTCEVLDRSAKCFSEDSTIFPDPDERDSAKEIALNWGKRLEKNCPLGYGDLELAVVFERRCPNNSLPILWSELGEPRWVPLFARH